MKILLRNYDIAIKECVGPLTHEILHNVKIKHTILIID
jgi:hypothetical protein